MEITEEIRHSREYISAVLANAGHPHYERIPDVTYPCDDFVQQPGFLVQGRPPHFDRIYVEWIDHKGAQGVAWRCETDRMMQTLRDAGYAVDGPLEEAGMWGWLRIMWSGPKEA